MAYDINELLALPNEEKISLANQLLETVEQDENEPLSKEEIKFLEERIAIDEQTPGEGLTWEEVKAKLTAKYGF